MAPPTKKAKNAPKPAPGSGLGKFFGAKSGDAAAAGAAPFASTPLPTVASQVVQPPVSSGGLTEAQKQRIEENRRMALERKQAKAEGREVPVAVQPTPVVQPPLPTPAKRNAAHDFDNADDFGGFDDADMNNNFDDADGYAEGSKSPSPLKSSEAKPFLKRNNSDITPEKTSAPKKEERRVVLPTPPATPVVQQTAPARVSPAAQAAKAKQDEKGVGVGEDKFKTFAKVSWQQYNSLYNVRLDKLRPSVLAQAKSLWSSEIPAENFRSTIDTSTSSSDVVFVGVSFKSMPSRDNVIEQYRDCMVATSTLPEDDVDKQPNLCSDKDVMWLEDGVFRIELELKAEQVAKFATGFVMAVRGSVKGNGKFEAKDFCMVQGLTSTPLPKSPPASRGAAGPYLALVSGLFIGAPDENVDARNRAVDFLLARNQKGKDLKLAKAVQQLIVCGGVYHTEKLGDIPAGLKEADSMFCQLAEKMPVDVLPGHKDPSNLSLPQMPLHPFFFRTAAKSSQFKSVSNPYRCALGDLEITGSAGQPIRDLMRCSSISTPLQALTTCLDASLISPTAPDTLATQAFKEADPFVIEKTPQVLFSGGHSEVQYEWRAPASGNSGTLCVCVPAFNTKPSVVLVNLKDPRDVIVQEFGA